jgi:hypothetical protein
MCTEFSEDPKGHDLLAQEQKNRLVRGRHDIHQTPQATGRKIFWKGELVDPVSQGPPLTSRNLSNFSVDFRKSFYAIQNINKLEICQMQY